jgi:hypothetical protein
MIEQMAILALLIGALIIFRDMIRAVVRFICLVVRGVFFALGIACILLGGYNGVVNLWFDRFVPLSEVADVSSHTVQQSGITYVIEEPIPQVAKGLYGFSVTATSPSLAGQSYQFYGDGQSLNEFVSAIDFVERNKDEQELEALGTGVGQGLVSLVEEPAKFVFEALSDPIGFVYSLGSAASSALSYCGALASFQANPLQDMDAALRAFLNEHREAVAQEAGFAYATCLIPQARDRVKCLAVRRIQGQALPQIGAMCVAAASVPSSLQKFSKLQNVLRAGKLRTFLASSLRRSSMIEFAKSAEQQLGRPISLQFSRRLVAEEVAHTEKIARAAEATIQNQCDPEKLASLAKYGANPRFHRTMNAMHILDRQGRNLGSELDLLLPAQAHSDFFYSPVLTRDHLLAEYARYGEFGLFDTSENLRLMSRGRSPVIGRGLSLGQSIDVDHVIPVSEAPELGNVMANLRALPYGENRSRGAFIDADALQAMEKFKALGWNPSPSLSQTYSAFEIVSH